MNEFSLISEFFKSLPNRRKDVIFGIGDDAACVHVPQGSELLISTDTLVSEVHFLPDWNPYDIAYKAIMVNVSDMAAMGAEPSWITLALTLPEMNQEWLRAFSQGLNDSLKQFNIDLIGGDTTRGPLSITITILGLAPFGQSVRRNGAKPDDAILVTGELGAAALAVYFLNRQGLSAPDQAILMDKLVHPKPRVDFAHLLQKYASSAIDISDGLSADLNHICAESRVGALLYQEALPIHSLLNTYVKDQAVDMALTGGDDYELCFTVPSTKLAPFLTETKKAGLVCHVIGVIESELGLRIKTARGDCVNYKPKGYSHF